MRNCTSCGKEVDEGSRFCGYCGNDFGDQPRATVLGMGTISDEDVQARLAEISADPDSAPSVEEGPKATMLMAQVSAEELARLAGAPPLPALDGVKPALGSVNPLANKVGIGGISTRKPSRTQPIASHVYEVEVKMPPPSALTEPKDEEETPIPEKSTMLLSQFKLDPGMDLGDLDGWPDPADFNKEGPSSTDTKAKPETDALADTLEGNRADVLAKIRNPEPIPEPPTVDAHFSEAESAAPSIKPPEKPAPKTPAPKIPEPPVEESFDTEESDPPQMPPAIPQEDDALAETLEASRAKMLADIDRIEAEELAKETGKSKPTSKHGRPHPLTTEPATPAVPDAALRGKKSKAATAVIHRDRPQPPAGVKSTEIISRPPPPTPDDFNNDDRNYKIFKTIIIGLCVMLVLALVAFLIAWMVLKT